MKRKWSRTFGVVIIIFIMIFNLTYQIHGKENISTANYCYDNFVEDFKLNKENVSVGDSITFTFSITDESKISEVSATYVRNGGSVPRLSTPIYLKKLENGQYVGAISVTNSFYKDYYSINIILLDKNGDTVPINKSLTFFVNDGISDGVGPVIEKVELSSKNVSVGDKLTVTLTVTDESEIEEVSVIYNQEWNSNGRQVIATKKDDGTYVAEIEITDKFFKDRYIISTDATDIYGNSASISKSVDFYVLDGISDVVGPVIDKVELSSVEVHDGDILKIMISAYDESEISEVTVSYTKSDSFTGRWLNAHKVDYGQYYVEIPITQEFKNGSYQVSVRGTDIHGSYGNEKTEIFYVGHNYVKNVIEPSCTEEGYTLYTCIMCGDSYKDEKIIPKLGHDYSKDWTIDKKATCTESGSKSHHCTRCDEKTDVTVIPKLSHNFDNGVITTAPTCTKDGVKTYTCKDCKTTKTEVIKALDHDYSKDWTIDKKATCTESGSKSHHCTRCDEKTDVTVIPKLSHDWILTSTVNPTRDHEGKKVYTCNLCNVTKEESISKLVGKWISNSVGKWYEYSDGTYENSGFKKIENETYYFTSNGYVKTGWLSVNNNWYFFKNSGRMVTSNWIGSYYMDSYGKMKTNAFTPDGYYVGANGTYLTNVWFKHDGKDYYVNGSGLVAKNTWSGVYYLGEDGAMLKNQFTPDGYYVGESGAYLTNQKITVSGKDYYLNAAGTLAKNQWSGDYYVDSNNNPFKEKWAGSYYLGPDGKYVKNQFTPDGYYCGVDGVYVTNRWIVVDGKDYYMNAYGKMTKDAWVGSYYLGSDGVMATSSWVDNNQYYVNENGLYVAGRWVQYGSRWCYYAGNVYAKNITLNIGGTAYTFDSEGYMVK